MKFEWDEKKNHLNVEKHSLNFKDAKELFFNDTLLVTVDNRQKYNEKRFTGFGYVNNRLMNIVYTERFPNIIRIISFRKANKREVTIYEKSIKK